MAILEPPDDAEKYEFAIESSGQRAATWSSADQSLIGLSDTEYRRSSRAVGPLQITLAVDPQSPDRIYPAAVQVKPGAVVNLDYWLPTGALGLTARTHRSARFVLPSCRSVNQVRLAPSEEALGRYVYIGAPDDCQIHGNISYITGRDVPEWITEEALAALEESLTLLSEKLHAPPVEHPLMIISADTSPQLPPTFRGDVGWRDTLFLRFAGAPWLQQDPAAAEGIRRLVRHEAVHFWIGQRYRPARREASAWLTEGAAEYLAHLLLDPGSPLTSAGVLEEVSRRLDRCNHELGDQALARRSAGDRIEYDCGFVAHWLIDLFERSSGQSSIWSRWGDAVRAAPTVTPSNRAFLGTAAALPARGSLDAFLGAAGTEGRNRSLDASIAPFGLDLSVTTDRSAAKVRETLLFHLLAQACPTGRIGFTTSGDFVTLDLGERCEKLHQGSQVRFINGQDILREPMAAYESAAAACSNHRAVSFDSPAAVRVAEVRCSEQMPALPKIVRIIRAENAPGEKGE